MLYNIEIVFRALVVLFLGGLLAVESVRLHDERKAAHLSGEPMEVRIASGEMEVTVANPSLQVDVENDSLAVKIENDSLDVNVTNSVNLNSDTPIPVSISEPIEVRNDILTPLYIAHE